MTSKLVIAFDPGGTTGYAHAYFGTRIPHASSWRGGQLGPKKHHKELWSLLASLNPDIVVCEDFVYQIRRNRGVDQPGITLMARNYIGVMELYCELRHKTLVMQPPSTIGVLWVADDVLNQLNLLIKPKTKWRHQNDAIRHLLYFAVTELGLKDLLKPLRPKM